MEKIPKLCIFGWSFLECAPDLSYTDGIEMKWTCFHRGCYLMSNGLFSRLTYYYSYTWQSGNCKFPYSEISDFLNYGTRESGSDTSVRLVCLSNEESCHHAIWSILQLKNCSQILDCAMAFWNLKSHWSWVVFNLWMTLFKCQILDHKWRCMVRPEEDNWGELVFSADPYVHCSLDLEIRTSEVFQEILEIKRFYIRF